MRNKIFKLILASLALILTITGMSIAFAWYTNIDYIGSIDADTEGLSFYYTLDDDITKNKKSYQIDNLNFFDIDNENELKYFDQMVTRIKLVIRNNDETPKNYTIGFESQKIANEANTSIAYPAGIISKEAAIPHNGATTIEGLFPASVTSNSESYTDTLTGRLEGKGSGSREEIIYLFVFGVQEIDSAGNEFLVDINGVRVKYNFNITIEATNISSGPSVSEK